MTKEELLKYCRYYKGEEKCPFKEGDNRGFFWYAEKDYLKMAERGEDCPKSFEARVQRYLDTCPDKKNIYTDPTVSIHTKGMACFIEYMSAKWMPMSRNLIFDY
ncbi:MAG: hypothetical protein LUI09_03660 [Prevotellaceae bacterium]|nr:hypothetical protein [Prevotellaceae bacterium]